MTTVLFALVGLVYAGLGAWAFTCLLYEVAERRRRSMSITKDGFGGWR